MNKDPQNEILTGLDPIVNSDSKLLILGSMPGAQSLLNSRYYDFGQNRFWKIIFKLARAPYTDDYKVKKATLKRLKIALWDSIGSCERSGSSLDSKIKNAVANDISGFLKAHTSIEYVVTNGRTSEKYLTKYNPDVKYIYLPSTSPANASVKNTEQLWLETLAKLLDLDSIDL